MSGKSDWHKEWENEFEEYKREIWINKNNGAKMNRRADVMIGKMTVEFQNSNIDYVNVEARTKDHMASGYTPIWILNCTRNFDVHRRPGNMYLLVFTGEPWRYRNFTCCDYIYLDDGHFIYKIAPKKVNANMITVAGRMDRSAYITKLRNNTLANFLPLPPQCDLYIKQRGAGCGKTYESIQIINSPEFNNIDTFIYLTKMHSAKEVIYNEFCDQLNKEKLTISHENDNDSHRRGRQFAISYTNNAGSKCKMLIGTIDAYMARYGDVNNTDAEYFDGLVASIINLGRENNITDAVNFGDTSARLCNKTMVIIDEAQDLPTNYIRAIYKFMEESYCNVCIIGDKLQSIYTTDNIFTRLEDQPRPNCINLQIEKGKNHVRRFHNLHYKNFVNRAINFKYYGVPEIEAICDDKACQQTHSNLSPDVFVMDYDNNGIENINVVNILARVDRLVKHHNYLPEDFMFIFPILTGNLLATKLCQALQGFWINKFKSEIYKNAVFKKNVWWSENWGPDKAHEYVIMHKSDEGVAIDLSESEYASRIMSIHAAKGTGRNVVFVLYLSEKALYKFTEGRIDLQYESLLHVALTRQKRVLQVGLARPVHPNIISRFDNIDRGAITNISTKPINYYINIKKIASHKFVDIFNKYNKMFDIIGARSTILNDTKMKKTRIVDWGHHLIRYAVITYRFYCGLNTNRHSLISHFYMVCKKAIVSANIKKVYDWKVYNNTLKQNDDEKYGNKSNDTQNNKKDCDKSNDSQNDKKDCDGSNDSQNNENNITIPVLYFSAEMNKYYQYGENIYNLIMGVKERIKDCKNAEGRESLPDFCPIESLIFNYMLNIINYGKGTDISIMDLYRIIGAYDKVFDDNVRGHEHCQCNTMFTKKSVADVHMASLYNNNVYNSILHHYESIWKIDNLCALYIQQIVRRYGLKETFTYNIYHKVYHRSMSNTNNIMKLYDKFSLIGWSKSYVMNIVFKPTFGKINFNETYIDLIHDQYIILNCGGVNIDRYIVKSKKIIHCIISLDQDKPIFIDINDKYSVNESNIGNYMQYITKEHFSMQNNLILSKMEQLYKQNNSNIIDEIKAEFVHVWSPKYIKDFLEDKDIIDTKKYDKNIFEKRINHHMNEYVDKCLAH